MSKSVTKKAENPLYEPLKVITERLTYLAAFQGLIKGRIEEFKKTKWVSSSSNLNIIDLTQSEMIPEPVCGFSIDPYFDKETYDEVIQDIIERNAGYTIAQSCEAFETFKYDLAAYYFFYNPDDLESEDLKKETEKYLKKKCSATFTLELWKEFFRQKSIKSKVLNTLKKLEPKIYKYEKHNCREIDLYKWYMCFLKVRHAVTHSDFYIDNEKIYQNLCLWYRFNSERKEMGEWRLQIRHQDAMRDIERCADYAFLIFKLLSLKKGYKWDLYR